MTRDLDYEEVRNYFTFNFETGDILRNGRRVGSVSPLGYETVYYKGENHYSHRILFIARYGYLPKLVDHVDGDKLNNSISNLRECSSTQNQCNSKLRKDNKTGHKGVYKHKHGGWYSQVYYEKVKYYLGYFNTEEEAVDAANFKREELHKEFERRN